MQKVSITRMELLAHKDQIELAEQGREMLEQKRATLMKELMRVAEAVMEEAGALQQAASEARRALARAEAMAGSEAVRSAALAARGELSLAVETANLMGVRVPHVEQKNVLRSALDRGYALTGVSIAIDEAAAAFEAEINAVLRLAESELRLRRLAREIQRLSRRANALEHLLIPRLKAERDYIQMMLEERERSEHYRLKLVKRLLERRRA